MLCLGPVGSSTARQANALLNLALLRRVAAQNEWPVPAIAPQVKRVADMDAPTWRLFRRAVNEVEALGTQDCIWPDQNAEEADSDWRLAEAQQDEWRTDVWALGPRELLQRMNGTLDGSAP